MLPIPKNFISCRELKTDRMVVYLREGPLVRKLQGTEPIEELDLRNKRMPNSYP